MLNLRRDILDEFRDAQDLVIRKLYARNIDTHCYWYPPRIIQPLPPPLETVGPRCLFCAEPSARVVRGFSLCELHACRRERCDRGHAEWRAHKWWRLVG